MEPRYNKRKGGSVDKAEKSAIVEQLRKKIGVILEPMLFEVERGAIKRFIEAVEDDNPLYWDDEYARKTRYGGVIAPPGFFGLPLGDVPGAEINPDMGILVAPLAKNLPGMAAIMESGVGGGCEAEYYQRVRPGDVLLTYYELVDIVEKEGKLGPMVIFIFQQTFKNKINRLVARVRVTLITY
jgi:hypothetical protein